MKDAFWNIKILIWLAVAGISTMVLFGALSWSQNHREELEPVLYVTLGAIFGVFLIRSFTHPLKDKGLFKLNLLGVKWVRNKQLNRAIAFLFLGVLVFGVNSPVHWIQTAHLIFTGTAIFAAYLNLVFYYRTKVGRAMAIFGAIAGIGGFLGPWVFEYTIAVGEAIAATPIVMWVLLTTKKYD